MKGIAEQQKPPAFGSTSFAGPELIDPLCQATGFPSRLHANPDIVVFGARTPVRITVRHG
jgi:hypothetical protein